MKDTAGIFVDYLGSENLTDIFHPTLQVCYLQGTIDVPSITLTDPEGFGSFEFNLPPTLTNPFLSVDEIYNCDTYFEQVSGSKWVLKIIGQGILRKDLRGQFQKTWRVPANQPGEVKIRYGGFRG